MNSAWPNGGKNTNHDQECPTSKCICRHYRKNPLPAGRWHRADAGGGISPATASFSPAKSCPTGERPMRVYIMLNDIFMQVINGAMTRPLDYDYLKSLPPAPQRFYEFLSYQMYAAMKIRPAPGEAALFRFLCPCPANPACRLGTRAEPDDQDSPPAPGNPAISPRSISSRRPTATAIPTGSCSTSPARRPEPNSGPLPNAAVRLLEIEPFADPLPQLSAAEPPHA